VLADVILEDLAHEAVDPAADVGEEEHEEATNLRNAGDSEAAERDTTGCGVDNLIVGLAAIAHMSNLG
jgi:hypothetical protein